METGTSAETNLFSLKEFTCDKPWGGLVTPALAIVERLFKLHRLEELYRTIVERGNRTPFVETILDVLNVACDVSELDLRRIPRDGPLIVVGNHPFGAIDGIILASILGRRRQDVKIMANYVLRRIPQLNDVLLFVDPYGDESSARNNLRPLKESIKWLRQGGALGIFPAGEVSYLSVRKGEVADAEWNTTVAGIIRKTGATVLPVFFEGLNSGLFHAAGLIHKRLRTVLLPRELVRKCNTIVPVRLGNPIPADRLLRNTTDREVMSCLRSHTYALRYRAKFIPMKGRDLTMTPDAYEKRRPTGGGVESDSARCAAEVCALPHGQILLENSEYVVVHARAHQIPHLLYEVGRLREHSFRQAGEGTGRDVDLDRFDLFYTHLLLWNKSKNEIVGGYRIGQVDLILDRFGRKGLYTNTLFHYKPAFLEQIRRGLELGRSFVRPEYQKKYTPLFYLWKGIGRFVADHPRYRVLFGPVTISNNYSVLSRELIVSFLKRYHFTNDLARLVKRKSPFSLKTVKKRDVRALATFCRNIDELSDLISCIEHDRKGVPVLLKQYILLGGKILGFTMDREFANGLDGLIMVDLMGCDAKLLEHYMGQKGMETYREHHRNMPSLNLAS